MHTNPVVTWMGLDFNLSTMLMTAIASIIVLVIAIAGAKAATAGMPRGMQNFMEWIIEFVRGPSSYQYTYTIMGNEIVDTFENGNPDETNESLGLTGGGKSEETPDSIEEGNVSSVDTNENGQVTIKEAKEAGFSMPITSDHWLYPYMDDRDGDGMVGE